MSYIGVLLLTVAGALVGGAIWVGCLRRDRVSPLSFGQLAVFVVAIGAACRLFYALLTPTFCAPDEQSHFNYVKYLHEKHRLPVQQSKVGAGTNDWEYYQPPLYYLGMVPFYWGCTGALHAGPATTVRVMRLTSLLLWLVNVLFALRAIRLLQVGDLFLKVFVLSMLCLLPTYVFLSSAISNDNLLIAFGGMIVCCLLRQESFRNSLLLGLLLGAALLTKLSAAVYVVLAVSLLVLRIWEGSGNRLRTLRSFALAVGVALLLWAPWLLRNRTLYGSFTAEETANISACWPSVFHAIRYTAIVLKESFWATAGMTNETVAPFPSVGMHVFYFAAVGFLYGLSSNRRRLLSLMGGNRLFLMAVVLAIAVNVVLVFRFGFLYRQGQGRHLFPLLILIALLLGTGLRSLPWVDSTRLHVHAVGFFTTYSISFACFSLAMFTRM
jgi:uncharacterized membrane protein